MTRIPRPGTRWAPWGRCLTRAGITDAAARRDHSGQRRRVARFAPAEYLAVRLLLPADVVPGVIAAVAFMHVTDDRIDQGDAAWRTTALEQWQGRTRRALAAGTSEDAVLRALCRSTERHPSLRTHVEEFLTGARAEVRWEGFAADTDVRAYVDDYAMPAFMLTAGLLPRSPANEPEFLRCCRLLIEAMQRLDWLEDLGEDLATGRIGIPLDALAAHGLDLKCLAAGECDTGALGRLLLEQAEKARNCLTASRELETVVDRAVRPFVRALIRVQDLRLQAVLRSGPGLLATASKPSRAKALLVLAGEAFSASRR
ncbi:squalene/phytoene synthase family protein [Streptomyces sp. NPDC002773]|uniref:phytoene/squalene synthase family protein n=1 Tax=Streptomyces sp. NPDC002773 TaxID=3154430 RepID=UPI00332D0EC2